MRAAMVVDFAEMPGVACPCGMARRAFADVADYPATIHVTDISEDAARHYHKRIPETYYFLECGRDARMELDGESIIFEPGLEYKEIGRNLLGEVCKATMAVSRGNLFIRSDKHLFCIGPKPTRD